jgi:hypothetical protein
MLFTHVKGFSMQKSSFLRTLALAGVVTLTASAALAGGDHIQQRRAAEDAAYWQGRDSAQANTQRSADSASQGNARSDVSQYPCHRCVYDHARGGYVQSSSPRK